MVRIDIDRIEEYYSRIRGLAAELRRRFPITRILLFGSFARGAEDIHELSDIDLVIVGEVPGRFEDRIGAVRELTDLPVEPLVYTDVEWARMIASENSFIEEVLATGKDL